MFCFHGLGVSGVLVVVSQNSGFCCTWDAVRITILSTILFNRSIVTSDKLHHFHTLKLAWFNGRGGGGWLSCRIANCGFLRRYVLRSFGETTQTMCSCACWPQYRVQSRPSQNWSNVAPIWSTAAPILPSVTFSTIPTFSYGLLFSGLKMMWYRNDT